MQYHPKRNPDGKNEKRNEKDRHPFREEETRRRNQAETLPRVEESLDGLGLGIAFEEVQARPGEFISGFLFKNIEPDTNAFLEFEAAQMDDRQPEKGISSPGFQLVGPFEVGKGTGEIPRLKTGDPQKVVEPRVFSVGKDLRFKDANGFEIFSAAEKMFSLSQTS
jgi:hypothetical protein